MRYLVAALAVVVGSASIFMLLKSKYPGFEQPGFENPVPVQRVEGPKFAIGDVVCDTDKPKESWDIPETSRLRIEHIGNKHYGIRFFHEHALSETVYTWPFNYLDDAILCDETATKKK